MDSLMGLTSWIVSGIVIGWVVAFITMADLEKAVLLQIILGVVGAIMGGWITSMVRGVGVREFNIYSFFFALIASCILILTVRVIRS